MDYYQILKIAPNASKKEIEDAYNRLLKESRYDTSIDKREIENAYKILSDVPSKNLYDSKHNLKAQTQAQRAARASRKRPKIGIIEWIKNRSTKELVLALIVSLVICIGFYSFRFGYLLKEFQPGDVLYDVATDKKYGKVLKVNMEHRFPDGVKPAYQIELDAKVVQIGNTERIRWLPQRAVKARCYKQKQ